MNSSERSHPDTLHLTVEELEPRICLSASPAVDALLSDAALSVHDLFASSLERAEESPPCVEQGAERHALSSPSHPTPQEATAVRPWRNAGEAAKPEGRSGLPLRRVSPPPRGGAQTRCHGRKPVELHGEGRGHCPKDMTKEQAVLSPRDTLPGYPLADPLT